MDRWSRKKYKSRKGGGHSVHESDEGSAARTRPFSYSDIMRRRKTKGLGENLEEGAAAEAGSIPSQGVVNDVNNCHGSEGGNLGHKDSSDTVEKQVMKEPVKIPPRRREGNGSIKVSSIVTRVERESHESGMDGKANMRLDTRNRDKGGKSSEEMHGRRKSDRQFGEDSVNGAKKRHSGGDELSRDRHTDRSGGKHVRGNKRKHQNGDHDKNRDGNPAKKNNLSKHYDVKDRGRKKMKESLGSRYEESGMKRSQSRSRDRDNRNRRSPALSPQAHKHTSKHAEEHKEFSSNPSKDRLGRQHSDPDRSISSNNGQSSQYRRHGGLTSGLGGYSPRKRRSEVGVKTPPSSRSPEKINAGWDLKSAEKDSSAAIPSNIQSSNHKVSSDVQLTSVVAVALNTVRALPVLPPPSTSVIKEKSSSEPVQLTQATRPMRRLYVENIPSSSSEKAVMECLNNFLLSSGVHHVQGTQPCISCIIHKEKGQALVEFLTPEDASAALSFDGNLFSGSILRIRRPKDFVELSTGGQEKSVAAEDTIISDIVEDSPNKIFVGGISKALPSEMLIEIATAFGPLKAYHFEIDEDLNEPCAFLEYVDQSVTLKACAGLSGLKLAGEVLTVVQATPNATSAEHVGHPPSYRIPEHAKPLLKQPTPVLKIKNVFNCKDLSMLAEPDVEEILQDIRLECARFGSVKSVNVVKLNNDPTTTPEACQAISFMESTSQSLPTCDIKMETEVEEEKAVEDDYIHVSKVLDGYVAFEDIGFCENKILQELEVELNSMQDQSEDHDKDADTTKMDNSLRNNLVPEDELNAEGADMEKQKNPDLAVDATDRSNHKDPDFILEHVFEAGTIFVEYGRREASTMAAHCLHRRLFNGQIIAVDYIDQNIYCSRFSK